MVKINILKCKGPKKKNPNFKSQKYILEKEKKRNKNQIFVFTHHSSSYRFTHQLSVATKLSLTYQVVIAHQTDLRRERLLRIVSERKKEIGKKMVIF